MSTSRSYSTFDSPKRFSWSTGNVARHVSSLWRLEFCCGGCFPRKRDNSSSPNGEKHEHVENNKETTGPRTSSIELLEKKSVVESKTEERTIEAESSATQVMRKEKNNGDNRDDSNQTDGGNLNLSKHGIEVKVSEFSETGRESVVTSMVYNISPQNVNVSPERTIFSKVLKKKTSSFGVTFSENVIHETNENGSEISSG